MFTFNMPNYIFVIDTDSYTGNFERQMTAYCTGEIGECEVGKQEAEDYREDFPEDYDECGYLKDERLVQTPDDSGCHRPCSIWFSPEGEYNSVVIFHDEDFTEEFKDRIKFRAREYCHNNNIRFKGIRQLKVNFDIDEL